MTDHFEGGFTNRAAPAVSTGPMDHRLIPRLRVSDSQRVTSISCKSWPATGGVRGRPSRSRSALALLLVLLPMLLGAMTVEEARRQTELARSNLASVERAIASTRNLELRCRQQVEVALRQVRELPARIDQTRDKAEGFRTRSRGLERDIPVARMQAEQLRNGVAQRQAGIADSQKRLREMEAAREKAVEALWARQQSAPEHQAAVNSQADAKAKADAAAAPVLERLAGEPEFRGRLAQVEALEARLKALRDAAGDPKSDPKELAEASTAAMKAKVEVEEAREKALAADPGVAAARAALRQANAALAARRARFDHDVGSVPEIEAKQTAMQQERKALATAQGELKAAQQSAAAAENRTRQLQADHAAAQNDLQLADRETNRLQRQFADAQALQRDSEQRLRDVQADLQRLETTRRQAEQSLRLMQQQEERIRRGR